MEIPNKQYTTAIKKFSCVGKIETPNWIAAAMIVIFEIVPKPGFSFSGIHNSKTTELMAKVAHPIVMSNLPDIPCARTDQGAFPIVL